jgi:tetratricopeptide (TPR) repeat protein
VILGRLGVALWQRQVAMDAQRRAEQRFAEVRQLANAIIFKIHDAVAPLPGSTPVRQMIVTEALAYLERLSAESAGDESLQWELAGAYRQIGAILGDPARANLGDRKGARTQLERARNLMLPLANRPSPDPKVLVSLVNSERLLASLHGAAGERAQAFEMAKSALAHAEQVFVVAPAHPLAGDARAKAAFTLAAAVQPGEASIPYWQRAGDLMEKELAAKPDDPERQRNVALVEKYLGGVLDSLNRDEEADLHYRRALEIDEKRLASAPNNKTAQFDVAIDLANVASVADSRDRLDDAYALFTKSLHMREQLMASDPRDRLAVGRVGYVQRRLSILAMKLKRPTDALVHAQAAVTLHQRLVSQTKDRSSTIDLAEALHALGKAQTALGRMKDGCAAYRQSNSLFTSLGGAASMHDDGFYARDAAAATRACDAGNGPKD